MTLRLLRWPRCSRYGVGASCLSLLRLVGAAATARRARAPAHGVGPPLGCTGRLLRAVLQVAALAANAIQGCALNMVEFLNRPVPGGAASSMASCRELVDAAITAVRPLDGVDLRETADELRRVSDALAQDAVVLTSHRDALLRSLVGTAATTTAALHAYFVRLEELKESGTPADDKAMGRSLPALLHLRTLDDAGLTRERRQWVATLHSCLATLQQPHVLQWYRVLANVPVLVEDSAFALDSLWDRCASPSVVVARLLEWSLHLKDCLGSTRTEVETAALGRLQGAVLAMHHHVCPLMSPVDPKRGSRGAAPEVEVELVRSGAVDATVAAAADVVRVLRCSRPSAEKVLSQLDDAVRLAAAALICPALLVCGTTLLRTVRELPRMDPDDRMLLLSPEGTLAFEKLPASEMMDLRYFLTALSRSTHAGNISAAMQHELVGPALLVTHAVNDAGSTAAEFSALQRSMTGSSVFTLPLMPADALCACLHEYTQGLADTLSSDTATVTSLGFRASLALPNLLYPGGGTRGTEANAVLNTGFADDWWRSVLHGFSNTLTTRHSLAKRQLLASCQHLGAAASATEENCSRWQCSMRDLLALREDAHRRNQLTLFRKAKELLRSWMFRVRAHAFTPATCSTVALFCYTEVFGLVFAAYTHARVPHARRSLSSASEL
jgi:hypothetical protein